MSPEEYDYASDEHAAIVLGRRWGKTRMSAIELERRGAAPPGSAARLIEALDGVNQKTPDTDDTRGVS